jgi:phage tail sheath gpL-like
MSGNIASPVPANLRVPLFWASFDNSMAGFAQTPHKVLLIGNAATAHPKTPVWCPASSTAAGLFGPSSMLTAMVAAYRANDQASEVWALPYSPPSAGTAAAGGFTFTGTATGSGVFNLYIDNAVVQVAVAPGDTAAVVAANAVKAVNTALLLVSAAVVTTECQVTARHKGVWGNSIGLDVNRRGLRAGETPPAGVTVVITPMTGGAGDPDLTTLATDLGALPYDIIVNPFSDVLSLGATTALLNDATGRWAWSQQLYGHCVSAFAGAVTDLMAAFGNAVMNDQHLTVLGVVGSTTSNPIAAAAYAGAIAESLFDDPARPLQTLPIAGLVAPPPGVGMALADQQSLLTNGVAVPYFGNDGTARVLRAVTTYQQNEWGQSDESYLDTETLFTLAEITRRLRAAVLLKFPRCKLADDGTRAGPGQPIVTPRSFKSEIAYEYALMESDGLVENASAMIAATVVERSSSDPSRLEVLWAPYLVGGLRIVDVVNQFRLQAAA